MDTALSQRVHELVEFGWGPTTTTETTASLVGRQPFAWWLFLIVIFLFPLFGGVLYLIYWWATSRATVFLHMEDGAVQVAGDEWLIGLHQAQSTAVTERQKEIREQGFLRVMWPRLLVSLALIGLWGYLLKAYF